MEVYASQLDSIYNTKIVLVNAEKVGDFSKGNIDVKGVIKYIAGFNKESEFTEYNPSINYCHIYNDKDEMEGDFEYEE